MSVNTLVLPRFVLDFRFLEAAFVNGFMLSDITVVGQSILDGEDVSDIECCWPVVC